jgi:hypothetical protein
MRIAAAAVVLIGILSASESRLAAQRRQNAPAPGPNVPQGVSADEFDQLFNSFVLMQAQQELRLRDDQYGPFATRLRNLQMVRRRAQNQRMRVIGELRRLTQADVDGGVDENLIREQLRALDEVETRTATEVHQAQANLDQLLDARQQARFRLLEERVDRQKVDLLGRVRQGAGRQGGARNPNANRPPPQF